MTERYSFKKRTGTIVHSDISGSGSPPPEKKRKTEVQRQALEITYNQTVDAIKTKKGDVILDSKEDRELNELMKEAQICKKHNLLKADDLQYNLKLVELKRHYMPGDEKPNGEPHDNWRYGESLADWKRSGKWGIAIQEGRYNSYMDIAQGYKQTIEKYFSHKELENIKRHTEGAIKLYQEVIAESKPCPEGIEDPEAEIKAHEKILEVVEQGINYHKHEIEIGTSTISENLSSLERTKVILRQDILLDEQLEVPAESKENLIFERAKEMVDYFNRSDRLTEDPVLDKNMALKQAQELHNRMEKEYSLEKLKEIASNADYNVQSNNNILESFGRFQRLKRPDSVKEKARAERDFYQHVSELSKQGIDYYDANKENIGVEDIAKKLDKLEHALKEINYPSEGEDISVETFNRSKGILEATDSQDDVTNMHITDLPRLDYIRDAAYNVHDPFKKAQEEIYPLSEDLRETWHHHYPFWGELHDFSESNNALRYNTMS